MKRSALVTIGVSSVLAVAAFMLPPGAAGRGTASAGGGTSASPAYHEPLCESRSSLCTDMYQNPGDEYVGHDEPSVLFKSGAKGSGNDITYTITLPKDPAEQPTASGATGTTWNFQLRPTFWFGLTLCDTESAPNFTKICKPDSDSNDLVGTDPTKKNYIGKHPGNAYMELQFYGPGYVPRSVGRCAPAGVRGKCGGRPGRRRFNCGVVEPVSQDGAGNLTRVVNCCFEHAGQTDLDLLVPRGGVAGVAMGLRGAGRNGCSARAVRWVGHQQEGREGVRAHPGTRRNQRHSEVRTFGSTMSALLALRDWLVGERVTLVVMEATSDYWKPVFYLLEEALNVELVNAAHAKGLPGRKSDVADSVWLCQMAECGLLRAIVRAAATDPALRDLTRYRAVLTAERDPRGATPGEGPGGPGIKLSAVATDILGVSARAMLAALIDGQRDPAVLAELARGRMRSKLPELNDALLGRFSEHHAFLCRMHLRRGR